MKDSSAAGSAAEEPTVSMCVYIEREIDRQIERDREIDRYRYIDKDR